MPTKEQDGLPWGQDYAFSYLVFCPGFLEYVSDHTSSPHMGWWGLITSSISQLYPHLYTIMSSVLRSRWAVSLIHRTHWSLWWQLASSPVPKRHFGQSVGVWKQLFPRNSLFYWVSYPVTILPILWQWKGGGAFLWVCDPLFVVLCFPKLWQKHISCTVSQYPVHWISRVHNRHKGLEFLVSVRTKG